jgi:hypothetical protein
LLDVQSRSILQEREVIMGQRNPSQVTAEQRATAILAGKQFVTDIVIEGLYGIPRKTLQNWRVLGRGPRFRKFGSGVRYKIADVEAYFDALPCGGDGGLPTSELKGAR